MKQRKVGIEDLLGRGPSHMARDDMIKKNNHWLAP